MRIRHLQARQAARHLGLTEIRIWAAGKLVATQIGQKLLGRADAQTKLFQDNNLQVKAAPIQGNPNHADIVGWPADKLGQKEIALELVRDCRVKFLPFLEE